jgi:hypothetical protein
VDDGLAEGFGDRHEHSVHGGDVAGEVDAAT